jgi:anti-sigma B factor antagonist
MNHQLDYDTGSLPDALVARLRGDVDMAVTPELGQALLAAVEEHSAGCLVVDLGSVEYVDSSGIELLFRLHEALTADAHDLIVVAPPGSNAARLLGLVAMGDIGDVRRSLAEALDRCAGRRETT